MIKPILQSASVGFTMALIEMKTHLLRSVLSIVGIFLGVASLVIMLTLIGGIDVYLNVKMVKWIGSVWFWKKYDATDIEKIIWGRSSGLRLHDADYLRQASPLVKDIPLEVSRTISIEFKNESVIGFLRGIDKSALQLDTDDIKIEYGNWFESYDYENGSTQCIISWEIAESIKQAYQLNSNKSVIGKDISFGDQVFTIKGIYSPKNKDYSPWHLRRGIYLPLRTMLSRVTGFNPDPGRLHVRLNNIDDMMENAKKVSITLKENHRGVEDFEYRIAEWIEEITKMLNNISILMGTISLLSLSAGGLSIMNVMLSSISERIREIGTRKALGANNVQIFIQFTTETITLSTIGGIFGTIIGCVPLFFKSEILQSTDGVIEPTILPVHLVGTTLLVICIGILFGLYPAIKACKMNPVDALRYE